MTALPAAAGGLVDQMLGEPPLRWHPVARYGSAMQRVEEKLHADRRANGIAFTAIGAGLGGPRSRPREDRGPLAGRDPRLPHDRRRLERSDRGRQLDHREDPPHRSRLPQLRELSTPPTPRLRHPMDYRAHLQNQRPPPSVRRVEPDLVLFGVAHGDLAGAIDRLPIELRAVVQATVLDGLTTREAASLFGIPAGTVKTRMMRARIQLRGALT